MENNQLTKSKAKAIGKLVANTVVIAGIAALTVYLTITFMTPIFGAIASGSFAAITFGDWFSSQVAIGVLGLGGVLINFLVDSAHSNLREIKLLSKAEKRTNATVVPKVV